MARGLPEGLVTTSDGVQADIESFDRVDVEDVVRLWKGVRHRNVGTYCSSGRFVNLILLQRITQTAPSSLRA